MLTLSVISGKAVSSRMMTDFGSSPLSSECRTKTVIAVFQPGGFWGAVVVVVVVVLMEAVRDGQDISDEEPVGGRVSKEEGLVGGLEVYE